METDQRSKDVGPGSSSDGALLSAFLESRDAACPRCGYNLRMLVGDTCPECGMKLMLGVHAAEPILRAWICAIVAAALLAGIGLLFIVLSLGNPGPPPKEYWWIMFTSIAAIPVAGLLLWKRRGFLRVGESRQWVIAAGLVAGLITILIGLSTVR